MSWVSLHLIVCFCPVFLPCFCPRTSDVPDNSGRTRRCCESRFSVCVGRCSSRIANNTATVLAWPVPGLVVLNDPRIVAAREEVGGYELAGQVLLSICSHHDDKPFDLGRASTS